MPQQLCEMCGRRHHPWPLLLVAVAAAHSPPGDWEPLRSTQCLHHTIHCMPTINAHYILIAHALQLMHTTHMLLHTTQILCSDYRFLPDIRCLLAAVWSTPIFPCLFPPSCPPVWSMTRPPLPSTGLRDTDSSLNMTRAYS